MGKISKSTLNRVLLRTQGCQFAHNYERMQSLSLTYCFAPVLEELYKDAPKEERVHAMQRHLEYFNTHPLAIPFILGITAAIEESTDEDQKDTVVAIKTSLMGPFAGLGDSLLNLTWFPIAGSIGASMCVDNGSIVGPLVMFLLINLLYWPLKYFGLHKGYEMGMDLVEKAGVAIFDRLGNLANVLGVMVTGGLIATTVKLKLAVQFAFGEGDPLVLQDQLDKVLPYALPVLLTFICYRLLKRGQGKNSAQIIIGLIVFALVFAAIGFYNMRKRWRTPLMTVNNIPMVNAEIVTGVSMCLLFVAFFGLWKAFAVWFNQAQDTFWMEENIYLGFGTLLLAHVTFNIPHVILTVMPKLRQMDKNLVDAAQDLGCTWMQAFWKVIIPEIKPGIISGALIAFTMSIDDFIISYFTAGSGVSTLAMTIYSMTKKRVSPEINAISTLLFGAVLLLLIIINVRESRQERLRERARA